MATPKDDEQDTHRLITEAAAAVEVGDYARALSLAGDALNEDFDNDVALFLCGVSLLKSGRWGLARCG